MACVYGIHPCMPYHPYLLRIQILCVCVCVCMCLCSVSLHLSRCCCTQPDRSSPEVCTGADMASAVFCPISLSTPTVSLRCSAEQSKNSASDGPSTSAANAVKLPLSSALPPMPLTCSSSAEASNMAVMNPALEYANLMWFRGSYNAQVFVGEDEPADSVVRRFRKAVMQAGVIPECRRRRFFETPQDIVKRKQQNARRRKTGRRFNGPRPEGGFGGEKKEASNDDDDFWGYAEEGADATL